MVHERGRPALVVGLVTAVLGYLVRWWARDGAIPLVWNDTADYVSAAHTGLVGLQRLAGPRPVLMPLVLWALGSDLNRLAEVQAVLAALAWGLVAAAIAACLPGVWRKVVAAGAVLALSTAWPVSMWDQEMLTESLALSTMAVLVAAALWFTARPTRWRAATLVVTAGLWLLARDSHVVPVALAGAILLVAAAVTADRRRLLAITGAYLVALSLLVVGAAHHGARQAQPLEHVFAARVLPYPDRVAWFADHGMPQAAALQALPEYRDPKTAPAAYTPVGADPRWAPWRAWLRNEGQAAFATYVAAHPSYVWREPAHKPERVFNGGGGIDGYKPLGQRDVPGLATVFAVPAEAVWLAAVAAVVALVARRRGRWGPLGLVGAVLVATSLPHAAVVWHSDGMEAARHLLIPAVQLRLGTLMLVLAALAPRPQAASPGAEDDRAAAEV